MATDAVRSRATRALGPQDAFAVAGVALFIGCMVALMVGAEAFVLLAVFLATMAVAFGLGVVVGRRQKMRILHPQPQRTWQFGLGPGVVIAAGGFVAGGAIGLGVAVEQAESFLLLVLLTGAFGFYLGWIAGFDGPARPLERDARPRLGPHTR